MVNKTKKDNPLLAAGLVGAMGLQVAIFILLGYICGNFISDRSGNPTWVVVGVLIGLAIGIVSAILVVVKIMGGSDG